MSIPAVVAVPERKEKSAPQKAMEKLGLQKLDSEE